MSFPLAFHFMVEAFEESRDFFKSPARANPLIDDVFQSHLELSKRQKLKLKSTALLNTAEAEFHGSSQSSSDSEGECGVSREKIEKYKK
jgi:hypothetical protein